MSTYFVDAAFFSEPPAYQYYMDQSPMAPANPAHGDYYTGVASYPAQPYYCQQETSGYYPDQLPSYASTGSVYDAAYSFHPTGIDAMSYIHAPSPVVPSCNTILHSNPTPTFAISEESAAQQSPVPFIDTRCPYSQPETPPSTNGIDSSTFMACSKSEPLTPHANDASSSLHEHSEDPRALSNGKKSTLRPSEVRRRRADRRRAKVQDIASALPFQATDPESLSTHERKRLFVSGLEEYTVWLEEQFRLVGKKPTPMLKVKGYKGINSRSLRTMLVYFQDEAQKLYAELQREERRFRDLEAQVIEQESRD